MQPLWLSQRFFCPAPLDTLSGMDEPHKLKDPVRALQKSVSSTRSEPELLAAMKSDGKWAADGEPTASNGCKYLQKDVLRAALDSLHADYDPVQPPGGTPPSVLTRILNGMTDEQHVRSAQALMGSEELSNKLDELGFFETALFRRVVHHAFEGADARGMLQEQRTIQLSVRTVMGLRLLGNRPFIALTRLPERIDGLSTQLIQSWVMNADSRELLLQRLPVSIRPHMNERATMQTYSVETFFSLLRTANGGYKPSAASVDPIMAKITWQHEIRSMGVEERGFHLPGDPLRSIYGRGIEAGDHWTWNDGTYLQRLAGRRRQVLAAAVASASVTETAVRSYFK